MALLCIMSPVGMARGVQPLFTAPRNVRTQMRQPVHHALHLWLVAWNHLRCKATACVEHAET
jgi:hypothetical protein